MHASVTITGIAPIVPRALLVGRLPIIKQPVRTFANTRSRGSPNRQPHRRLQRQRRTFAQTPMQSPAAARSVSVAYSQTRRSTMPMRLAAEGRWLANRRRGCNSARRRHIGDAISGHKAPSAKPKPRSSLLGLGDAIAGRGRAGSEADARHHHDRPDLTAPADASHRTRKRCRRGRRADPARLR